MLGDTLNLPVRSVAILLCKEADSPAISGELQQQRPNGAIYLTFRFEVIRVWKTPPEHSVWLRPPLGSIARINGHFSTKRNGNIFNISFGSILTAIIWIRVPHRRRWRTGGTGICQQGSPSDRIPRPKPGSMSLND
ncbi:MAG: hypothetical protein H8F28_09360 [Fibrella sp.]|nr:hypothetical protein [Armatimonadota bacterium]